MSVYLDIVFACDLKEDTPEAYINTIRCLTDRSYELNETPNLFFPGDSLNIWEMFGDYHFLAPDPQNGTISCFHTLRRVSLQLGVIDSYCLRFSGRAIKDDDFAVHHLPFIHWLAHTVEDGFIGYMKETTEDQPSLMFVRNGEIKSE